MTNTTARKDLNILIRNLPVETNLVLATLAVRRGVPKWQVIRDALIEYAHRNSIKLERKKNG